MSLSQLTPASVVSLLRRVEYLGNLPPFAPSTVAAQKQTIEINGAWNIEALQVQLPGITAAMLQQVQLYADGVVFQTWGPNSILDARCLYDGAPALATNGVLTIPFNRLGIIGGVALQAADKTVFSGDPVTVAVESSLNMGVAGGGLSPIQTLRVDITVANTLTGLGAQPVYGLVTQSQPGGPGRVLRVLQQSKTLSNGQITINKSEFGFDAQTQLLNRIYFDASQGLVLDQVKINYGGQLWRNFVPSVVQANLLAGLMGPIKAAPQAGLYVVDFQGGGIGTDMLDLSNPATDFNIQATASGLTGSPSVNFYVEVLGPAKAS